MTTPPPEPDDEAQPAPPPYPPPPPPVGDYAQPVVGQPPQPSPGAGYPPGPYGYPAGYPGYSPDPAAPYGREPLTGRPYSDKSKVVAGLLQLFLGSVGAGRWYTGQYGIAVAQLLTCGGCGVWALVDGILMLVGKVTDSYGRPLRD